jgi:vancomycin permeability regulator SanA
MCATIPTSRRVLDAPRAVERMERWIVVMGARVLPGGRPSGALRRRVAAALAAADAGTRFLVTGAVGDHPPSEARVMAELLRAAGVPPARIVLEETGTDTLSSLRACARLLRAAGAREVVVCSDDYHLPRCRAVLRALGVRARGAPARGMRAAAGTLGWLWALVREAAGLPWDVALAALARRGR